MVSESSCRENSLRDNADLIRCNFNTYSRTLPSNPLRTTVSYFSHIMRRHTMKTFKIFTALLVAAVSLSVGTVQIAESAAICPLCTTYTIINTKPCIVAATICVDCTGGACASGICANIVAVVAPFGVSSVSIPPGCCVCSVTGTAACGVAPVITIACFPTCTILIC